MGLYESIRAIATENGYTINQLEKELEFVRGTIYKFNINRPNIDRVQKIAEFLNVSIDYIVYYDPERAKITDMEKHDIYHELQSVVDKLTAGKDDYVSYDGVKIPARDVEIYWHNISHINRKLKKLKIQELRRKVTENKEESETIWRTTPVKNEKI